MTLTMNHTSRTSQLGMVPAQWWHPKIHVSLMHEVFARKYKVPTLKDREELAQWVEDGSEAPLPFVEAVSASVLHPW